MKADALYAAFRSRGVPGRGALPLLPVADALDLVAEAADEGVPIRRVHGTRASGAATASPGSPSGPVVDFGDRVAEGHGCWAEAEAFLRERADAGLVFEIALGDDPLEVV